MSLNKTDTTRYLCAAAYLNKSFRDLVIQQIIKDEYRAIAISHGVDLLTVVKHCFIARKREFIRDSLLAILLLIALLITFSNNNLFFSVFFLFFLIACGIVFWERWQIRYIIVAKQLTKQNFNPNLVKLRTNNNLETQLEQIPNIQNGNVIVYGGFSPFVGSGIDLGGWSFAINLDNPKEELGKNLNPIPFQIEELYKYVVDKIKNLEIQGLIVEDKLCVNGQEIRNNTTFLPNHLSRPNYFVEPTIMKKYINQNTFHIRYYKLVKVISWNGQFILSIFIRFIRIKQKLFTEVNYFLLTPVKKEYQEVDSLESRITWEKVYNSFLESSLMAIFIWLCSPFKVFIEILNLFEESNNRKIMRKLVRNTPNFNYGAITSIREAASSLEYTQYFQKLDKEMYLRLIDRQIIDSLVDFLDSKNIDTSDLKEKQTAISNNGIIVSGGSIEATNIAVGENAKSKAKSIVNEVVTKGKSIN